MKSGPIILVEDDVEDEEVFADILKQLNVTNKLHWFNNCPEALDYLKTTPEQPFIIFCDVNLPVMTGVEFKRQIDADPQLRTKSIPFVFYSTAAEQSTVNEVYTQMTVQGFFQKGSSFKEIRETIDRILGYWRACKHPNTR
jgi:CheY-like chemotaxis protein